jgi:hypothetical protein
VLLAAIASHRVGFGLMLIVLFGIGLAATLTVLGIAVVRGAGWLARRPRFTRVARYSPIASAATISLLGAWTIGEGAVALGLVADPLPTAAAIALAIATVAAASGVLVPAPRLSQGEHP